MPQFFHNLTREEWLALKAEDVSSTEVSALFNVSPYTTAYELHHRKIGNLPANDEAIGERAKFGLALENAIAKLAADELGLKIRIINGYARHDSQPRMGSSFDYEIIGHERGPGILEIKNVDFLVFRDKWRDVDGSLRPPDHIQLQVQHQLEVINRDWAVVAALVAGNRLETFEVYRAPSTGRSLCLAVQEFWDRIDAGVPPDPDWSADVATVLKLYDKANETITLDLRGQQDFAELCRSYSLSKQAERVAKKQADELKARIFHRIGEAGQVLVDGWAGLRTNRTKDAPPTIVDESMIGQEFGGRRGYRRLDLKPLKQQ